MTDEKCKTKLAEICEDIVQQNHELMNGLDQPDFDPAIRLDNAKNNAGYKLTNFFDILKLFPHGSVPDEMTSELITTTDALIVKIRKKYGNTPEVLGELIRVGQAFRNSKRIWRIKNPIVPLSRDDYAKQLDISLHNILRALDDLNYAFNLTPRAKMQHRKSRGHFYSETNPLLHKERAEVVAEMRRRKTKSQQSWSKIVTEMRLHSSYSARLRGKTDTTWIRYAKSGFSG